MTNKIKNLKTQSSGDKPITAISNDCKNCEVTYGRRTLRICNDVRILGGDKMNTITREEMEEKRQTIEDTKYYIKCKQDDINDCYDNIENINVEVKELREKIQELIFTARTNGIAIVKLRDDKEWLENDLNDLQSEPDEDMGRDR